MAISNKDVEVLSEALFCYYFAIYKNKKEKDYNPIVWYSITTQSQLTSFTNRMGITPMVKNVNNDPAFISRLPKAMEFLFNRKSFWSNALESQMKAFFSDDEINFPEIESTRNYLQNLIDGVGNFSAIKDYALEIKECFFRRELIRIGSEMIKDASDLKIEDISEKQIDQAESKLYGLAENVLLEQGPKNFDIVLTDTIKQIDTTLKHDGNLSGLDTGLIDLNSKLGGLHASDLLIIAGRPGMGKTALATNIAYNAAKNILSRQEKSSVAFFSLEMSSEQLSTLSLIHI